MISRVRDRWTPQTVGGGQATSSGPGTIESSLGALIPWVILVFGIAAIPVLLARLPILEDYPIHLARAHIITMHGQDPLLDRFYDVNWRILPDLAFDIVVPPLAEAVGIYPAGKIFVLLTLALLITAPLAIHRALFGKCSAAPLIAAVFLYNRMFLSGLVSYFFTLGLALWAVAVWIALRRRSPAWRGAVSGVAAPLLYVGHLAAFGVFGLAVLCIEIWCFVFRPQGKRYSLQDGLAFALPFASIPVLLLAGAGSGGRLSAAWDLSWKLEGLWYVVSSTSARIDAATGVLLLVAAAFLARKRALGFHPAGFVILVGCAIVYLAMPVTLLESFGADLRLPAAFVLLLIGFVSVRFDAVGRMAFLTAVVALVMLRTGLVAAEWHRAEEIVAGIQSSMSSVERGSTVLVARSEVALPAGRIAFVPCLVIIERSSLCSLEFSNLGKWILNLKPEFREKAAFLDNPPLLNELIQPPRSWAEVDPSHEPAPQPVYWANWRSDYDYLYLIVTDRHPNPIPDALQLLREGPGFQLFRILRR